MRKAAELTGYTEKAVNAMRERGIWLMETHWVKAPDGRILINMEAVDDWLDVMAPVETCRARSGDAIKLCYYAHERRKAKRQRTPVWADRSAIRIFYIEARNLTLQTGVKHHVDHIIPLRGKHVSGLHIESNLQVIPATANIKKRNHFDALSS